MATELRTKNKMLRSLKKRYDGLYSQTNVIRGVWNELERFVVPYRGRMFTKETGEGSVDWDKYDHYDDTAVVSAQTLSASMHGSILPNLQWFYWKFEDHELQSNNEASDWIDKCAKLCYNAINRSNFSLESDELFLDLAGFGHGFQISEAEGPEEQELTFDMIPLKEAVFDEDHHGQPHFFFRKLEWTPTKIVSKWGYDNVPKLVQERYDNEDVCDIRMDVIFAIWPRHDKKDNDTSIPLAPTERPFGYMYFLHESEIELGEEGGYYEMPVYSVRWRKVSGSQWGHGPGHIALGDIRQLNQHRLMRTRAIEKAVDPANLTTERGLMSTLDLGPRGLTVVRDINELVPYESRANFQVSAEELSLLQHSIKQAFRVDQLELKESPAMTATEVQVRYELMQRLLGPTLGRLKVDWLDRVISNVFSIEYRAGRLPKRPTSVPVDAEIQIEYVGAMATAQKTQQANDILQWAGEMAQLGQMGYSGLNYLVDADKLGREIADLRNIPEMIVNGEDEVKKQKQEDAEEMQKQENMEQQAQSGQAMEAMGKGQKAMAEAEAIQ